MRNAGFILTVTGKTLRRFFVQTEGHNPTSISNRSLRALGEEPDRQEKQPGEQFGITAQGHL